MKGLEFYSVRACFVPCAVALALLFHCGCRRKGDSRGVVAAPSTAQPGEQVPARVVEELNYALQDYRERTGKLPASISELLTASKLPPPQLPPGAQLRINAQFKTIEYVGPGGK